MAATNSSPWELMELRPLHKSSTEKWEQHKSRCQEEKNDEGIVKMNKSKAEPVGNWGCQRQAGSIKVHQRVVWSLIFLVFGMYLVKAEVQEDQAHKGIAREVHPDHQDELVWMKKSMTLGEDWCLKQKRKKNSQGKDPRTLKENSQGGDVGTPQINSQGDDPRTFGAPAKRWRAQKKRQEKKWKRKKKKRSQKWSTEEAFGEQSAKNILPASLCRKGRKKICGFEGREGNKSPRTKQYLGRSGRWLFLLLLLMQNWFCADAAAGRLEPRGEAEVREIIVVSDVVEGTFVILDL